MVLPLFVIDSKVFLEFPDLNVRGVSSVIVRSGSYVYWILPLSSISCNIFQIVLSQKNCNVYVGIVK